MGSWGLIIAVGTKTPCCGYEFQDTLDGNRAHIAIIRKDGKEFTVPSEKSMTCRHCGKTYEDFPHSFLNEDNASRSAHYHKNTLIPLDRRYLFGIVFEK